MDEIETRTLVSIVFVIIMIVIVMAVLFGKLKGLLG